MLFAWPEARRRLTPASCFCPPKYCLQCMRIAVLARQPLKAIVFLFLISWPTISVPARPGNRPGCFCPVPSMTIGRFAPRSYPAHYGISPAIRLSTALFPINVCAIGWCTLPGGGLSCGSDDKGRQAHSVVPAVDRCVGPCAGATIGARKGIAPFGNCARFTAWLSHVTGASANHHRATLSPPLPRPRPAEPAPAPVASNKDPAALASAAVASKKIRQLVPVPVAPKKKTPAVLIND